MHDDTRTRLSRRSRAERTKRRERYIFHQENDFDSDGLSGDDLSPTARQNNNCLGCRTRQSFNHTTSNIKEVPRKKDLLYKILVIGDLGTGKTSIIKRYVHQFFSQHYRATIGVDFALKVINWDEVTTIRLQLWDIAGQERYGNMTRVYYKDAVGAFIVFDVTRVNSFESVANWKADLDNKVQLPNGAPIPCILLANKCDQPKEGPVTNVHKMEEYCKEKNFAAWFETSAKDNINIDDAAKALIQKILQNDSILNDANKDDEHISLHKDHSNHKKMCSC